MPGYASGYTEICKICLSLRDILLHRELLGVRTGKWLVDMGWQLREESANFPCHQGGSQFPACDILEGSAMQTVNIIWICTTLRRWLIAVDLLTVTPSILNALFSHDFAANGDHMTRFCFWPDVYKLGLPEKFCLPDEYTDIQYLSLSFN